VTPASYETRADGYCRWRTWDGERERYVYVHQLVAIADGASPYLVFSDGDYHIHHRSGFKYDNRAENLDIERNDDHARETFGHDDGRVEA